MAKAILQPILLAAMLVLAGSGPALAAPDKPDGAAGPLWSKQCTRDDAGREICYVEQYAVAMPGNTVLLNVSMAFTGQGGRARLVITAPLGVQLIPGLVMTIDAGKPVTLPFESCHAGGCRMIVELDEQSLDQIRRGAGMTVRFVNADGKALDIPVPLKGLAAALKQLQS
ncbi:invasion associated locus B family protein [Caulobacter soli]|uniref:invasion associated locus B family protein n=1 Tax=Caulobacter soli TaxID=2708539 RepID=UPI0013EACC5E|nr:invasion associated locus B family protein [Caulobacter soli]